VGRIIGEEWQAGVEALIWERPIPHPSLARQLGMRILIRSFERVAASRLTPYLADPFRIRSCEMSTPNGWPVGPHGEGWRRVRFRPPLVSSHSVLARGRSGETGQGRIRLAEWDEPTRRRIRRVPLKSAAEGEYVMSGGEEQRCEPVAWCLRMRRVLRNAREEGDAVESGERPSILPGMCVDRCASVDIGVGGRCEFHPPQR
jgi:hypothetical protein